MDTEIIIMSVITITGMTIEESDHRLVAQHQPTARQAVSLMVLDHRLAVQAVLQVLQVRAVFGDFKEN